LNAQEQSRQALNAVTNRSGRDEAPTDASPLEARMALLKTVARAASTLKFQHFFAVGQIQTLASRRRALTMPVPGAGASSAAAASRQTSSRRRRARAARWRPVKNRNMVIPQPHRQNARFRLRISPQSNPTITRTNKQSGTHAVVFASRVASLKSQNALRRLRDTSGAGYADSNIEKIK
jgi:hypothetical protein